MAFIEITGVSKSFPAASGPRQVLRHVSLSVDEGEFVSVVGAMGSGKTTLLGILAGLATPDSGTITIGGEAVRGITRGGAFVFQNYSLLPWFSALENVRLAVSAAFPELSRERQRQRAHETLERMGLGNAVHRRPGQLSGGMRQRVALARALATDPKVLFLDEPFGALDALTRDTLQAELARLCTGGDRPVTTVMITNSVEEAILLSDRIVPILPGPPATLGTPIHVPLARPRSAALFVRDDQASRVRAQVVATLTAAAAAGRSIRAGTGASRSLSARTAAR